MRHDGVPRMFAPFPRAAVAPPSSRPRENKAQLEPAHGHSVIRLDAVDALVRAKDARDRSTVGGRTHVLFPHVVPDGHLHGVRQFLRTIRRLESGR